MKDALEAERKRARELETRLAHQKEVGGSGRRRGRARECWGSSLAMLTPMPKLGLLGSLT